MVGEKKDPAARERESLFRRERARLRTARIVSRWHRSLFYRASLAFRESVMMTDLRAFALLLTPLGLIALSRTLILPLLTDDFPLLLPDGIAGGLILLLSLLLFTYRDPLAKVLTEDTLLSRLFFETLGLPRPYFSDHGGLPIWLALPLGLLLGALALLVSPLLIIGVLAVVCVTVLTLVSPEFGLILLGILFPLSPLLPEPTLPLLCSILLSLLSYLLKLVRGKRRFSFTFTDLAVLLLALFLFLSCVFGNEDSQVRIADGVKAAILFAGGYLLTANLLATRRTLLHFTRGLLIGGSLLALAGIFCRTVELVAPEEISESLIVLLGTMETVMGNGVGFTAILLLLYPLLPVLLGETHVSRMRGLPVAILLTGALALTLSPLAYLALFLSLLLFLIVAHRRSPIFLVILLGILPNFLIALPSEVTDTLSSVSFLGIGELLTDSLRAQADTLLLLSRRPFGIGFGYADAGNLHLQLASSAGIPSLILFLLLLLSIADCSTRSEACLHQPHLRRLTAGVQSGVFALLVFGVLHAPLNDFRVLLVFALLLGILVAVRRAIIEVKEGPHPITHKELNTAAAEVRLSRRRGR